MKRTSKVITPIIIGILGISFIFIGQKAGWLSGQDYYVYDGDTIYMKDYGKIRYIGIDTPERDMPFYEEAKEYNEGLLKRGKIQLEFGTETHDKYGRVLAYVFVETDEGERIFVCEELVRAGLATTKYVKPEYKYAEVYYEAERDAQGRGVGIWAEDR